MKSAMEVGTKIKSTMEVATETCGRANEIKTVMEVSTEWICKKAEMICAMEIATQVKSTMNGKIHDKVATKMKFTHGKQEWQIK